MRFADLSQEATQQLWDKWKYAVREILDEFNDDVYHCKGVIRENSYTERSYLLLEAKKECLYVFPMPGDLLFFGIYHHTIPKEHLNLKRAAGKPDEENLIGWHALELRIIEERYGEDKYILQQCLGMVLKNIYRKYWIKITS